MPPLIVERMQCNALPEQSACLLGFIKRIVSVARLLQIKVIEHPEVGYISL